MASMRTAEEIEARSVAAMPGTLGKEYFALYREVAWVHLKWKDFRALFTHDQATVGLLNEAAPDFFGHLQGIMWESVLLHLCRLTDPPKSGCGRDNLSIRRLPDIVDEELKTELSSLVAGARQNTEFSRDWRNRALAHKDLGANVGQSSESLAAASSQQVEEALKAIRKVMNCLERHYLDGPVSYEHSIEAFGGVASLVGCLQRGLDAKRRKGHGKAET